MLSFKKRDMRGVIEYAHSCLHNFVTKKKHFCGFCINTMLDRCIFRPF